MYTFLLVVHITACLLLVFIVLLQAGRGAGLAVFGGGGVDLLAAPTSTGFMKQLTAGLAVTFAITSLLMTLLSGRSGLRSVTSKGGLPAAPPAQEAPAAAGEHGSPAVPAKK